MGLGKIVDAGVKAYQDTARQVGKTVNDVADGVAKSLDEFTTGMNKEIDDVGKKAKEGDFFGAAMEFIDAGSLGTAATEALGALGLGPKDGAGKEFLSGLINGLAGNPIAAMKDMGDAFGAMSSAGSRTIGTPAAAQSMPSPTLQFDKIINAALEEAKGREGGGRVTDMMIRPPRGYPSIEVRVEVHHHHHHIRPGCTPMHWHNWMQLNPPIMRPPIACINDAIRDVIRDRGISQKGPSDPNQPLGERSIQDILNDPSLSFEDMVALVMFKVCQDERKKVEAEIAKLSGGGDAGGDKQTSGAGKSEGAGKSDGSAGAQGRDGLLQPLGGPGGEAGGFDLGMVAKLALGVAGGPGGLALAFASDPQMLQGALGMAKGLAPMLAPMISGALMAAPPIGPLIAPFVPMLLPMVLDVAEQAAGSLAGGAAGGAGGSQGAASGSQTGDVAGGVSRGSEKGKELASGGSEKSESVSRQETMEMIKIMMQRLQEMQQALSNVLNSMHEGAMNSIRNIK